MALSLTSWECVHHFELLCEALRTMLGNFISYTSSALLFAQWTSFQVSQIVH